MPVKLQPTFQTAEADIDSIVSFFDRRDPLVFYSRANVPVMLSVMSIHPDAPEQDAFTMLSPDALFNFSIWKSLSGRDKNSLHQHNYFEFMFCTARCIKLSKTGAICTSPAAPAC